jgi:hypothetical protein
MSKATAAAYRSAGGRRRERGVKRSRHLARPGPYQATPRWWLTLKLTWVSWMRREEQSRSPHGGPPCAGPGRMVGPRFSRRVESWVSLSSWSRTDRGRS